MRTLLAIAVVLLVVILVPLAMRWAAGEVANRGIEAVRSDPIDFRTPDYPEVDFATFEPWTP